MTSVVVIPAHGGNGLLKHPARGPRGKRHPRLQPPAPSAIPRPMQSPALTFDTHAFVKRLTQAGMSEDQAEVLAHGQADLYEHLVTKEYFQFTLTHELEKLRAKLKHDIDKVQANLEITRTELKRDIKELKRDIYHLHPCRRACAGMTAG